MKKQDTKIKFIFESPIPQSNFYIKNTHSSIQKLNRLFPVPLSLVIVHIFQNRVSFLKAIHKQKTPDWLIAFTPSKNTSHIYIFNNKEKIISKKILSQVILHEITHLYTNTLNLNLSDWLKEGISVYVAAQIFKPSISTKDWKKITQKGMPFKHIPWKVAAEYNGYNIAGLLVMFFVRRYGWKKLIIAISSCHLRSFPIENISSYFGDNSKELIVDFKKQFVK